MKKSVVLFDLDGTLIDTYQAILDSLRYATNEVLGAPLPDDVLLERVGQPLATQILYFTDDPKLQEILLTTYRAHNEHDLNAGISPLEGIVQAIEQLKSEGFRCAVVTSKRHTVAQGSLEYFDMMPLFELLIGLEDCTEHKPLPQPLIRGAQAMGVSVDECIYVGDSPYDIQAAHAAGMTSLGVTYGKFFSREVLEEQHPTMLVDSTEQIPAACMQLA